MATGQAKVNAYQLAWNLTKNVGAVRLWVAGTDEVVEKDLAANDFVAVSLLLTAPDAEIAIGKDANGSYLVAGRKDIATK